VSDSHKLQPDADAGAVKIGIVTVLYKSDSVIDGFIDSMNAQGFRDFHVYFVENDVDSQACEHAIRQSARFGYTFVRNQRNVGVAAANNQGLDFFLADATHTHILLVNNDIKVEPDFLLRQVAMFAATPDMDALAPKMFYHSEPSRIWYAGGELSYLKGGVRHLGHNKADRLTGKPLYRVSYAPTCSLMIRSQRLRASGIRMWEELFVYADDYQFCKELRHANIRLYYAPGIPLWHKISTSTGGRGSDFSRYHMTRNWFYLGLAHRNLAVLTLAPLRAIGWWVAGGRTELRALRDGWRMACQRRGWR
jgi:GT2 family glycosyltransferase